MQENIGKTTVAITYNAFAEKNSTLLYAGGVSPFQALVPDAVVYKYLLPTTTFDGHDRVRLALGKYWHSSDASAYGFEFDAGGFDQYLLDFAKNPLLRYSQGSDYLPSEYSGQVQAEILLGDPGPDMVKITFNFAEVPQDGTEYKILDEINNFFLKGRTVADGDQASGFSAFKPLLEQGAVFTDRSFLYQAPLSNVEINALGGSLPGVSFASVTTEFSQNTKADAYIRTVKNLNISEPLLPSIYSFNYWKSAKGQMLIEDPAAYQIPGLETYGDVDSIYHAHIHKNLTAGGAIELDKAVNAGVGAGSEDTPLDDTAIYLNEYASKISNDYIRGNSRRNFFNLGFSSAAYRQFLPTEEQVRTFPMHAKIEMSVPAIAGNQSEAYNGSINKILNKDLPELFPAIAQIVIAGTDVITPTEEEGIITGAGMLGQEIEAGEVGTQEGDSGYSGPPLPGLPGSGTPPPGGSQTTIGNQGLFIDDGTPSPFLYISELFNVSQERIYTPTAGEFANTSRAIGSKFSSNYKIWNFQNLIDNLRQGFGSEDSGGSVPGTLVTDHSDHTIFLTKQLNLLEDYEENIPTAGGSFQGLISLTVLMLKIQALEQRVNQYAAAKMRSYKEIMAGELAEHEILMFRIEKQRANRNGSFETVQNIFLPGVTNTENSTAILNYFDTQVHYDQFYRYRVFAYTLVVGTQYSYGNINISSNEVQHSFGGDSTSTGTNYVIENIDECADGEEPCTDTDTETQTPPPALDLAEYVPYKILTGISDAVSYYKTGLLPVNNPIPQLRTETLTAVGVLENTYNDAYRKGDLSDALSCPDGWQLVQITLEEELQEATWNTRSVPYTEEQLTEFGIPSMIGVTPGQGGDSAPTYDSGGNEIPQYSPNSVIPTRVMGKLLPNSSNVLPSDSFIRSVFNQGTTQQIVSDDNPNVVYACVRKPVYTQGEGAGPVTVCEDPNSKKTTVLAPDPYGPSMSSAVICLTTAPGPLLTGGPESLVSVIKNMGVEFKAEITASPIVNLIEVPYFNTDMNSLNIVLDKPPLPPDVQFIPQPGRRNDVQFFLNRQAGEMLLNPIEFGMEESLLYDKQRVAQDVPPGGPILFKNDSPNQSYLIYRSSTPPNSVTDLSRIGQTGLTFFDDVISSNTKYYYAFRSIDNRGSTSYPTSIFEVELVTLEDGNPAARVAVLPLFKEYIAPMPILPIKTNSFRKYILIRPNSYNLDMNTVGVDMSDPNKVNLATVEPKFGGVFSPHEGGERKKFKLRLTSKSTGRKLDINFSFTQNHNKPPKLSQGGPSASTLGEIEAFNPEDY